MKLWRNIINVINKKKDIPYFCNNTVANRAINKAANKIPLGTGYESMVLLDNSTLEMYGPCSNGKSDVVTFSNEMKSLITKNNANRYYTVIHNHPQGGAFSVQDVMTFLRYDSLSLSIVIGEEYRHGEIAYYALLKMNVDPDFVIQFIERVARACRADSSIRHKSYRFLLEKFNVTFEELGLAAQEFIREV